MRISKILLLSLICSLFTVCLVGCEKIELIQNRATVELGEDVKLEELVSYDTKKVASVSISSDGGFNSEEIGDYTIMYTATTPKGKSEEFAYTISVVDTVAPQLKFNKTEFNLVMGAEFDVDSVVTITDKDTNVKIVSSGEFDLNKEGVYVVSYTASDSSGNQSEPVEVKISVCDRSGADFRNAFFGDDAETIKAYETLTFDSFNSTDTVLMFNGENIGGVSCHVVYLLNNDGKLYSAFYSNERTTGLQCIDDYYKWVDLLKQKYGEPNTEDINILSTLAQYCADDGQALELGYVQYWTEYEKEDVIISCYADSDGYNAYTILRYNSKEVTESADIDGI